MTKKLVHFLRFLFFPFSVLYGIVIKIRHWMYEKHFFESRTFRNTICIGNISVGGTGKSPMIEYLIRCLLPTYKVGVVSRGYKRKTKGLVVASENSAVSDLGDEPFQFWKKYPEINLVVDSDRVRGIEKLFSSANPPDVILLDDAFQHRRVKAQKNVVLTSYGNLYTEDYLLPVGRLRDVISRVNVADVIVVTKCPSDISENERKKIEKRIRRHSSQKVVFTKISYSKKIHSNSKVFDFELFVKEEFTLVTGIANPYPLVNFLTEKGARFNHLKFADHHHFSISEIKKLKKIPRILTTEKDFVRLQNHLQNVYYLPIETVFISEKDEKIFWEILEIERNSYK